MLFCKNLDKIIFSRNQLFNCDELVIISGYVGPHPVHQLDELPINQQLCMECMGVMESDKGCIVHL